MPSPNIFTLTENSRMRAMRRGLIEHFTEDDTRALLEFCNHCCMACGLSSDEVMLSIDHIVPLVKGGTNTPDNLQILCKRCNSKKHTKTIDYRNGKPVSVVAPAAKPASVAAPVASRRKRDASQKEKLVPLVLRLPEELHAQLTNKAHDEERSLNAQVVVLLRSALAGGNCQNSPTHRQAP